MDDLVVKKFAGIPIQWTNETETEIVFESEGTPTLVAVDDTDEDAAYTVNKENGYFVDEFEIKYQFDVTTSTHYYYTLTNVLASLGGVLALAGGVVGQITTLITFSFFWQFGAAVKNIAAHDIDKSKIRQIRKQLKNILPLSIKSDKINPNIFTSVKDMENLAKHS